MKRTLIALARALGLSLALAGTADASTLGDIRRRIQQVAAAPVPAPAPAANASILDDFCKSLEQVKKVAAAAPPPAPSAPPVTGGGGVIGPANPNPPASQVGVAMAAPSKAAPPPAAKKINGLDVLATDCSGSKLPPHTGFQSVDAQCVSTGFGEVSAQKVNPTLLITMAPGKIKSGQEFTLEISTRNLVRDRLLGAAQGGYYVEASTLDADGIQRGHAHVACDVLRNDDVAPQPSAQPKFFKAIEDGKGGKGNTAAKVTVPGKDPITGKVLFRPGDMVRCSAWAGDGSHRIPMMSNAKETPAFDSVRIMVRGKM